VVDKIGEDLTGDDTLARIFVRAGLAGDPTRWGLAGDSGVVCGVFTKLGGTFTGVVNGVGYCVRGTAGCVGVTWGETADVVGTLTPLKGGVFKFEEGVVVFVTGGG
jgi:hypothetical protein